MKSKPKNTSGDADKKTSGTSGPLNLEKLSGRHLKLGWWALLIFISLGMVLEALHGFKAGLYLDVSNSTRRLMWSLAHAHGTLLGLVNIAFAVTIRDRSEGTASKMGLASGCLRGATVLMPSGFFLGGVWIYGGDPGLGIILLPVGALMLLIAVYHTAAMLSKG
jgi:hypothetical protein